MAISYKKIKNFRIATGVIFLILLTWIFMLPGSLRTVASYLQFGPLTLRSIVSTAAIISLLAIVIVTLLWGRVYCSFVCPVGILQDIANRLRRMLGGKRAYSRNHRWLRYSILGFTVSAVIAGTALPLGMLEPFTLFGRFSNMVIRPAFVWLNNLAVAHNIPGLYPVANTPFSLAVLLLGGGTILAILLASLLGGRIFCNTLCPVGAALGILSRFAWFKIRVGEHCVKCTKCVSECKSGCIDLEKGTVDNERCVMCFNCLTACKPDAMILSHGLSQAPISDLSRRDFFIAGGAAAAGTLLMPALLPLPEEFKAVMPPGAIKFKLFTSRCTACQLCVSNCPGGVLKPADKEYGKRGFLQPVMDFNNGMCEFDCTVCSDICPNGALVPVSVEQKHTLQLGIAHFRRHNCIVRIDKTHCGACAEHCPTGAVHMVPWGHGRHGRGRHGGHEGLTIPQVEPELCIGCGACEHVCPARPKAITVTGLKRHDIAESPADLKVDEPSGDANFLF